jgi:hypothetical protein
MVNITPSLILKLGVQFMPLKGYPNKTFLGLHHNLIWLNPPSQIT